MPLTCADVGFGSKRSRYTVGQSESDVQRSPRLGVEKDVMRRDPSDIINVDSTYYVWYTKGAESGGYNGTVWYATSPDGHAWTEQSEALALGEEGTWDGQSVFTCLLYTSPSPRDQRGSRMPSSA